MSEHRGREAPVQKGPAQYLDLFILMAGREVVRPPALQLSGELLP